MEELWGSNFENPFLSDLPNDVQVCDPSQGDDAEPEKDVLDPARPGVTKSFNAVGIWRKI